MRRIVVGVDGSAGSVAALEWAIAEATTHGAAIDAVNAFHVPYAAGSAMMPLVLDPEQFREAATAELAKVVEDADSSGLERPIRRLVVEGTPAGVLIEAGRDADLIVVGSRGHGGLAGMLLGSVSRQVTEHATVPVVVVPWADES